MCTQDKEQEYRSFFGISSIKVPELLGINLNFFPLSGRMAPGIERYCDFLKFIRAESHIIQLLIVSIEKKTSKFVANFFSVILLIFTKFFKIKFAYGHNTSCYSLLNDSKILSEKEKINYLRCLLSVKLLLMNKEDIA